MADSRKPYKVTVGGIEHSMLLTAEDAAQRYGDQAVEVKQAAPENKSRKPENKSGAASKK